MHELHANMNPVIPSFNLAPGARMMINGQMCVLQEYTIQRDGGRASDFDTLELRFVMLSEPVAAPSRVTETGRISVECDLSAWEQAMAERLAGASRVPSAAEPARYVPGFRYFRDEIDGEEFKMPPDGGLGYRSEPGGWWIASAVMRIDNFRDGKRYWSNGGMQQVTSCPEFFPLESPGPDKPKDPLPVSPKRVIRLD